MEIVCNLSASTQQISERNKERGKLQSRQEYSVLVVILLAAMHVCDDGSDF